MFNRAERISSVVRGKPRRLLMALVLFSVLLFFTQSLAACSLYTIRPIQANSASQGDQFNQQFNAVSYTNGIWASRVIPTVMNKAVDLHTVLSALQANTTAAEKQYAVLSSDGFYNFMVKGQAQITAVNTSSRNGIVNITLPAFKGQPTIIMQIGPVITGTALRDSVGFINFNQFTNQVQYAEVANQFNLRIAQDLHGIDFNALKGKTITFYGAFTFLTAQYINIVPVKIIPPGGNA